MTQAEYARFLVEKYEKYIENIEWHLKENKPYIKKEEEDFNKKRITLWKEIIDDLKILL